MNIPLSLNASFAAKQEMLNLLARQSSRVPFGKIPAVGFIAALAWFYAPLSLVVSWTCLALTVLIARWVLLHKVEARYRSQPQKGLNFSVWLSFINGLVMAGSLLIFPYLPEVERAIHTLILLGVCTGAIATTAGYLPLFLSYAMPITLPLVFLWATLETPNQADWTGPTLALLLAMFMGMMISLARDTARLYLSSFQIRSEQSELNTKLQHALDQAEVASNTKTRFLASASHDLRQPIHTLSLFSAALIRRPIDEKSKQIASHMDHAIQSLATQLDTLLDISKLEAGVVDVTYKTINFRTFLSRLFEEHLQSAKQKNLHLGINGLMDIHISTDPVLVERILRNLLSNAIKYTDAGGVDLNFQMLNGRPTVEVIDSGRGIPLEEQTKIFEEFYQLNNPERDRNKGLGLGLAIVKRLTQLININLELTSTFGKGTQVRLLFPSTALQREASEPIEKTQVAWHQLNVMAVDDETDALEAMRTLLNELGCQVICAKSTETAMLAAQDNPPDILLADVHLGYEEQELNLVNSLRKLYPKLPVLLVSGQASPEQALRFEQANLKLLQKPVTLKMLTQAIQSTLKHETVANR